MTQSARIGDAEFQEPKKRGRSSKVSRERILEAALSEFAENGYEGATTAAVARRVSVTQPLIHYHFGSKEALWRASVELAFGRMQSLLQGVEEDMQRFEASEAIQILARRFVYFNAKYPEVARLTIAESSRDSARLRWMTDKHIRPLFQQVEALFRLGKSEGIVRDLPMPSIIFAFLGAVPHFFDSSPLVRLMYGIDSLEEEHVEAHAKTIVEIFTRGLMLPAKPQG